MSVIILRDTVAVDGPDAAKYLQGQLSNDVVRLAPGESSWSLLLEPTGKLGFLVRVLRVAENSFALDVEEGVGPLVEARLKRFLIRTKVELAVGSEAVDVQPEADGAGPSLVGWWGEGIHRVVTGGSGGSSTWEYHEGLRVTAGWPGAAELTEGIIPGETGVVPVTVSFTKGCYTGQELVARVDSRGNNVPHHLSRIALGGPASVGDEVLVDGEVRGTLTSVSGLQALAYVHRSVEIPAEASIGGLPAQILPQR